MPTLNAIAPATSAGFALPWRLSPCRWHGLAADPERERAELAGIYEARGLTSALADQVTR